MQTLEPHIIVFAQDCYDDRNDLMWEDITTTLQILFRLGYQTKVYADCGQPDIICVEYIYQDEEVSSGDFRALTWKQIEFLDSLQMEEYNEEKS